ncbi:MAG: ABC-F family ATP-binding cassette domain-containing protein, partial [Lachnospiraceae bacterium]|nr:ABC-F family ATP-binding cassette domain-containing protein [Lachnospiraceae bacterium]
SNGTGKTTLLKILNGIVPADDGICRTGTDIHIGYYDQEYHVLHDEKTVFEEISDEYPHMTNTQVRSLLAAFLFTGDDVFKKIAETSGGEKGRISLAKLMLSGANLLFLDEPTNHLDIVSREILENALNAYSGTVIYVSHDRYFVNRTASRILELKDGRLKDYGPPATDEVPAMYIGNYDSYLLHLADEESTGQVRQAAGAATSAQSSDSAASSGVQDWKALKQAQADKRRMRTALARCEEKIAGLEEDIRALEEKMLLPENAANSGKLRLIADEMEKKNSELSAAMEDWEKLAAGIESDS